ncbi:MAG: hypothetical protein OXT09_20255 [Myxococcales bacterium]|nr:hypothetical protein [Myxococcales bacterium]
MGVRARDLLLISCLLGACAPRAAAPRAPSPAPAPQPARVLQPARALPYGVHVARRAEAVVMEEDTSTLQLSALSEAAQRALLSSRGHADVLILHPGAEGVALREAGNWTLLTLAVPGEFEPTRAWVPMASLTTRPVAALPPPPVAAHERAYIGAIELAAERGIHAFRTRCGWHRVLERDAGRTRLAQRRGAFEIRGYHSDPVARIAPVDCGERVVHWKKPEALEEDLFVLDEIDLQQRLARTLRRTRRLYRLGGGDRVTCRAIDVARGPDGPVLEHPPHTDSEGRVYEAADWILHEKGARFFSIWSRSFVTHPSGHRSEIHFRCGGPPSYQVVEIGEEEIRVVPVPVAFYPERLVPPHAVSRSATSGWFRTREACERVAADFNRLLDGATPADATAVRGAPAPGGC